MVCDKSYHKLTVGEFQKLIRWESIKNRHHVFPARLIKGAGAKAGLGHQKLETKFGINLGEVKFVPMAAHCFYNDIFRNSPPPVVLNKLSRLISGEYVPYRSKKISFAKFSLCVVREKLRDNFSEIAETAESIDIDINNGNEMRAIDIVGVLGLSAGDIVSYLENKFFPKQWRGINPELWNLYL